MQKRKILWQIFPTYMVIVVLSLLAVTWYATISFREYYYNQTRLDLLSRAYLVKKLIVNPDTHQLTDNVDVVSKELGAQSNTRITIIKSDGTVVGESDRELIAVENHLNRPEIQQALDGHIGVSRRYSNTLNEKMMYVSIPLENDSGEIYGVIRTSFPVTSIDNELDEIRLEITLGGFVIALLAIALSLFLTRRISQPLEDMKKVAERFARGDLACRLPDSTTEEIDGLSNAMNSMAKQLDERIRTISQQRTEQQAILSSMVEGVLAVDKDEKIISMNQAAKNLLETRVENFEGRHLQEVIRNKELHQFVAMTLNCNQPVEGDILIHGNESIFLQAHGTGLHNENGDRIGGVIVLNDITRLRRLENVRREFVANVSHELKTPITAIKGFVETLQDGAIHVKDDAEKFLHVILRHVDRLSAIIEDLLSLSRIEQDRDQDKIQLAKKPIGEVIKSVMEICDSKAKEKNVRLTSTCSNGLSAMINPPLLEQALVNLVDNAVKFSENDSEVTIGVKEENGNVVISVLDQGYGIDQTHLPRIFERFYRIDKGRSRKQGGTGLGLAIVKHIAQAHGGHVSVESEIGEGSVFSIHLTR